MPLENAMPELKPQEPPSAAWPATTSESPAEADEPPSHAEPTTLARRPQHRHLELPLGESGLQTGDFKSPRPLATDSNGDNVARLPMARGGKKAGPADSSAARPKRARARRMAFVCNMRPQIIPQGCDDEFEEYDSPATIAALAGLFAEEGYQVTILEADRNLPRRLAAGTFDLVFNMAEGKGGRCREAHVPALCEMLGLHYTGSDPLTLAATLDKAVAKRIVSGGRQGPNQGVATPRWVLVRKLEDLAAFDLQFPVFAKPNDEGSSKGITEASRCETLGVLEAMCAQLLDLYGRPVLVEEFIRGPEVTVGVIGNDCPEVIGMMHVLPRDGTPVADFVYSLGAKRYYENRVRYAIPPELPDDLCKRLEIAALTAYRLLECRDVARIDFRVDEHGVPHFIEANPLPGLSPLSGDIVIMAKAMGWTWDGLVQRIVREAEFRQGLLRPTLVPNVKGDARRKASILPLFEALTSARAKT